LQLTNQIKSIAIGSFDGIHTGHRTLIDKADALVIIERNGGYLTPGYKRANFTAKICCFYHFDKIKSLTPQEFVHRLEADFPALERIVVGYDFHFGKGKSGNAQMLSSLCDKEIMIIDEVSHDEIPIHSRTIKAYLREGKLALANGLLGRRYTIDGEVIKGQGLGKKELFPTINLQVKEYQLPLEGVYATRTRIADRWYSSVSFLGHRVTTDDSYAVETHLLDQEISVVEGEVFLEFVEFIRINQKFDSLEALKEQIQNDIIIAKKLLV
jgi:riboflavin kinase / FMN adenylyltransferase